MDEKTIRDIKLELVKLCHRNDSPENNMEYVKKYYAYIVESTQATQQQSIKPKPVNRKGN